MLARLAGAQLPDTTRQATGSTVSGVVRDSISGKPVVGAVVQLVAADSIARSGRTTVTDSLGRFSLADVPAGRYVLGFFHPMLDSLGVEAPWRKVVVDGRSPARADLAIPSSERLRTAICGPRTVPGSDAVLVGIVRDARAGEAIAGVTVTGEWAEFAVTSRGIRRHIQRLVSTTAVNGWFALCGVPRGGEMALMATRAADSTDFIGVQVPADGFLRRELYLGPARLAVSGVVVAAVGETPIPGAQVNVADLPPTRANERGEWTLAGVPAGTRTLEVRAVGYSPERTALDVVTGAPPVRTALTTMEAMLDTVRVKAASLDNARKNGFYERRRAGMGRYITAEDVAQRRPFVTTDLFQAVPGLHVDRNQFGEPVLTMRGAFVDRCTPAVYVDGQHMDILSADDIDGWVNPDEIAGIEIYSGPGVPAQFSTGLGGIGRSREVCGSIVIWTKPPPALARPVSWKRRVITGLGLVALALGVRALLPRR